MNMRAAVVDGDGNVVNVIEVDDLGSFDPGDGLALVEADDDAEPGGTHDHQRGFTRRPPAPEPEPDPDVQAIEDATTIEELKDALIGKLDPVRAERRRADPGR